MIYFDNAATSKPSDEALDTFVRLTKKLLGNPSSNHSLGFEANQYETKAKTQLLKMMKVPSNELIFTSGASESNNMAIEGIARRNASFGKHLITSLGEHASVLNVFQSLEKEGFQVTYLHLDSKGNISLDELKNSLDEKTTLVCLMSTNNETGVNYPVEEFASIIHKNSPAYFMSDVTQGILKVHLDYNVFDVFTMSGHKIGGLKSSGFVCFKNKVKINGLIIGGEQQDGYRAGTINAPLNCSLATAYRVYEETFEQRLSNVKKVYTYIYQKLAESTGEIEMISSLDNTSYYIMNFVLLHYKASVVVEALSSKGVFVSTRSACSSKTASYSYVIKNMGYSDFEASNDIRISFEGMETIAQADEFLKVFFDTLKELQRI